MPPGNRIVAGLLACSMFVNTAALAQQSRSIPGGHVISGSLSFDGHPTAGDFTGTTTTVSGRLSGVPDLTGVRGSVEATSRITVLAG